MASPAVTLATNTTNATAAIATTACVARFTASSIHRLLAKLESLDLAGGGLRQLAQELDPAGVFVRHTAVLDALIQRHFQHVVRVVALLEDHERPRLN